MDSLIRFQKAAALIGCLICSVILLYGCQGFGQPSAPKVWEQSPTGDFFIPLEDGVKISSRLIGTGERLLIMANGGLSTKDNWGNMPQTFAARGYSVMTFDYRGLGKTGGSMLGNLTDMPTMLHFMQARGFSKVVCLGASAGGAMCEIIANEPGMAGMVTVSGVTPLTFYPGLDLHFEKIHYPVLMFVSELEGLLPSNQWMYDQIGSEDKKLVVIPGGDHVPLDTQYGPGIIQQISDFLDRIH